MPALKLLCQSVGVNPQELSKEENLMLEHILFAHVCEELKDVFKSQYKNYFRIIKYTLSGIACYTQTPEDVILEIVTGRNFDPSASLLRKIVELHRSIRPELYREIIKKLAIENLEYLENTQSI
jgi:hypothetical protein